MKGGREHRVALSRRALAILEKLNTERTSEYVFTGPRPGTPLSGMAMEMILRRMKSTARRFTALEAHSATGAARYQHLRANLPRLRLLTLLAIRRSAPIAAAMRWRNDAHLWRHGQPGTGERRATSFRFAPVALTLGEDGNA